MVESKVTYIDGYNAALLMSAGYAGDSPEVELERKIHRMWKNRGPLTDKERQELNGSKPVSSSWKNDPIMVQREK